MLRILIAPDKFKGSLTSQQVCESISEGILSVDPETKIISIPMADGGDGFASILKTHLLTETISCRTVNPLGRPIESSFEWKEESKTAIVELAATSGLVLLPLNRRNPMLTSTYGTGLVIKQAIQKGAETILLGLGGSATNEGGIGILAALGFSFRVENGEELPPTGESLQKIDSITPPADLPKVKFVIACDVNNVLLGEAGASAVYGPQKGATKTMVNELDDGLKNLNNLLIRQRGVDHSLMAGTGAAGGIAIGLLAYFDVEMRKGVEIIAGIAGLEDAAKNADYILTGEGQIDGQSAEGKVVSYLGALGKKYNRPVIAFTGRSLIESHDLKTLGLTAVYSLPNGEYPIEYLMTNAGSLLKGLAEFWFREEK